MKKLLILFIIPFLSFGQDLTYVPDDNFEQALIDAGLDDILDNYVLTSNISNIQSVSIIGEFDSILFEEAWPMSQYNYIYLMSCGFNENDTFRSNQIREGQMSREDAYSKLIIENRPRWDSMQWYFNTIQVDFKNAINIVNNMKPLY